MIYILVPVLCVLLSMPSTTVGRMNDPWHILQQQQEGKDIILCGNAVCSEDQFCCNESCGICSNVGDSCVMMMCEDEVVDEKQNCGDVKCGKGEYCCNPSCSICSPEGDSCMMIVCSEEEMESDSPSIVPTETANLEDVFTGISCGNAVCADGEFCCNPSRSLCYTKASLFNMIDCNNDELTSPSDGPSDQASDEVSDLSSDVPSDLSSGDNVCGNAVCTDGDYCCNESCSICAKEGEGCFNFFCWPESDDPLKKGNAKDTGDCGTVVCETGEYCCNESCSHCVLDGGVCLFMYCGDGAT